MQAANAATIRAGPLLPFLDCAKTLSIVMIVITMAPKQMEPR